METSTPVYCVNHPKTETLLRCNRCGRPVCIKCVQRTPVGYRCKDCLSVQQAGYYNATPLDYILAGIAGLVASIVGGLVSALIGFFLFEIFYAPFAGGIIAEVIRWTIQKHRGRYVWLLACAMVIVGGIIGTTLFPLLSLLGPIGAQGLFASARLLPFAAAGAFANIGFIIYVVLAVGTVYARLR